MSLCCIELVGREWHGPTGRREPLLGPADHGALLLEDVLGRIQAVDHGLARRSAVRRPQRSHANRREVDAASVEDALGQLLKRGDELGG